MTSENPDNPNNKDKKSTAADAARSSQQDSSNQRVNTKSLIGLPGDVLRIILAKLPEKDLNNVARVSKKLHRLARGIVVKSTSEKDRGTVSRLYDSPVLSNSTKKVLTGHVYSSDFPAELRLKKIALQLEEAAKLPESEQKMQLPSVDEKKFIASGARQLRLHRLSGKIAYQYSGLAKKTDEQINIIKNYFDILGNNNEINKHRLVILNLVSLAPYLKSEDIVKIINFIMKVNNFTQHHDATFYKERLKELVLNSRAEQADCISIALLESLQETNDGIKDIALETLAWVPNRLRTNQVKDMVMFMLDPHKTADVARYRNYKIIIKRLASNLTLEQVEVVSTELLKLLKESNRNVQDMALDLLAWVSNKLTSEQVKDMVMYMFNADNIIDENRRIFYLDILERFAPNLTSDQVASVSGILLDKLKVDNHVSRVMALEALVYSSHHLTPCQVEEILDFMMSTDSNLSIAMRQFYNEKYVQLAYHLTLEQVDSFSETLFIKLQNNYNYIAIEMFALMADKLTPEKANHIIQHFQKQIKGGASSQCKLFVQMLDSLSAILKPDQFDGYLESLIQMLFNLSNDVRRCALNTLKNRMPILTTIQIKYIFEMIKNKVNDESDNVCAATLDVLSVIAPELAVENINAVGLFESLKSLFETRCSNHNYAICAKSLKVLNRLLEFNKLNGTQTQALLDSLLLNCDSSIDDDCDEATLCAFLDMRDELNNMIEILEPKFNADQISKLFDVAKMVFDRGYDDSGSEENQGVALLKSLAHMLTQEQANQVIDSLIKLATNNYSTACVSAIHAIVRLMPKLGYEKKTQSTQMLENSPELTTLILHENSKLKLNNFSVEELRYMLACCNKFILNQGDQNLTTQRSVKATTLLVQTIALKLNSDKISQEVTNQLQYLSDENLTPNSINLHTGQLVQFATQLNADQLKELIGALTIKLKNEKCSLNERIAALTTINWLGPRFKTERFETKHGHLDISLLIQPLKNMLTTDTNDNLRNAAANALRALAPCISKEVDSNLYQVLEALCNNGNILWTIRSACFDTISILLPKFWPSSNSQPSSSAPQQTDASSEGNDLKRKADSSPTAASAVPEEKRGNKRPRTG